jgi:hypothetical protein
MDSPHDRREISSHAEENIRHVCMIAVDQVEFEFLVEDRELSSHGKLETEIVEEIILPRGQGVDSEVASRKLGPGG